MTKIVFLYSTVNIGDEANANSIFNELSKKSSIKERFDIDVNEDFSLIATQYLALNHKDIVFAVGEKAMSFLSYLHKNGLIDKRESIVAATIHQYDDGIKKIPLDYLALPAVVLDNEEKRKVVANINSFTLTFSVPTNNPSTDILKQSYDNWNIDNKPSLENEYIIIMLPGDAPDSKNNIRYFTKQSAELLFEDIKKLWLKNSSKHKIIIHNGPRTGRYDSESGEISCNHESEEMDQVSQYFLSLFERSNIEYQFFNFYFKIENGTKTPVSVFNQLLYLSEGENKDNYFIVPGESVSMLGQIPLYLESNKVIVFKSSSMNEAHELVFNSAVEHNYVSYFDDNSEVVKPNNSKKRENDDVSEIVDDFITDLDLKGVCKEDLLSKDF